MDKYFAALILTSALNLFAVCRMLIFRLQTKLSSLVAFLIFQFAQSVISIFMTHSLKSRAYQQIYEVTEPLNWILYILIVREMYSRAFAEYPGISSLSRWASYLSAAFALLLCVALAVVSPAQDWAHIKVFGSVEIWERFVAFGLSAFILLMVFLVSRYPIKLDFNILSSIIIFAVYFFGSFVFLEIGTIGTATALGLQTGGLLVTASLCFAAWGFLLRRSGNTAAVQVRVNLQPFEEERLLDQLAFINNMLVKSARE